jgi:outer membrane protein assembly factor BamA
MYKRNHINFARRKEQLRGGSFLNISPGVKYSTLDNENMPRDGLIAKANFIEALGIDDIHHSNGRLIGGITKYIPVFKKSTLSIGAKGGVKVHGKEMPEVMAFRLGGPYSVRGFKMNGVGTGEHFIMGSAELQTPIPFFDRFKYDILKNMRFAFFVDAGKVFDPTISSTLYDGPLSAISGGIGLRIYIPNLGPISIDYGIPITNPGHYGKRSGQFTFGTSGYYDSYY